MSSGLDKKKFFQILKKLNIKSNDKLLVSSNIIRIIEKKEKNLNPEEIIEVLKKIITPKGTLLFPTFSWDFCKKKIFDYHKTKSIAGALSNLTLEKKEFRRSINPIHSFTIYGKDKNIISKIKHKNSFGMDSPFGYLIKKKGKQLFINIDYKDAFTFVHVAEEELKVNYRFRKKFIGYYKNSKGIKEKKTFSMFCKNKKKIKRTAISNKFDLILKKNKALKVQKFKSLTFSVVDIAKAYSLMIESIKRGDKYIYPARA